jgi:hypothetical protein
MFPNKGICDLDIQILFPFGYTTLRIHWGLFIGPKIRPDILVRFAVQVSLVIRGRYVLSFWTANPEFADKKSIFD